ncbi:hypothetical protein CRI77_11170 [Mycolicibacterium duvalii]|uniref:AB hydrolase-1 domain-containing protein n=1 Tax=Mycolicibacterium duvalii TaxID=39688 RepID=A0A7I7K0X0_9MYCO|nr:alpha/beta fold hydrolase [Mycolicibacterium duvalii]MCV7370895.1 hypothetical protein [Mycolicibacterium duvalii]PEG41292.1 hypothetical protein CRI77_11170 [Mycolicibacterium duvalii]BBX17149.1 hypothetical protein MDUV_20090 [Mycolicibacterium duvalii]
MAYRSFVWLIAAMLAVGMWLVVLAGAGVAAAGPEPGSDSGSNTPKSSESSESSKLSKPSDTAENSDPDKLPTPGSASAHQLGDTTTPAQGSGAVESEPESEPADEDVTTEEPVEPESADEPSQPTVDRPDRRSAAVARTVREEPEAVPASGEHPAAVTKNPSSADPAQSATEPAATLTEEPAAVSLAVAEDPVPEPGAAPTTATMIAMAAAPNTSAAFANPPSVLDLLGTVFFNIFTIGFHLFQGPPQLPPGSTVTLRTSALEIAPGREVPADWYVPENADLERLIYFQHGFITNARSYSYTLAALAEETHSIVVAPSLTSNFFAPDAFWLAGVPMQQAIARLFVGDRDALTDSASQALNYDVALGQRVVLMGHSYGAQAVVGAAGAMDDGTIADVAGIVLLDGVSNDRDFLALGDLPATLPVYNLSSAGSFLSGYGAVSDALAAQRPHAFNGFQLAGGSHVDTMQGGNPIVQFIANVVTGNPLTENVEAAKSLIAGWANDMFAGTDEGSYAAAGATIQIPTRAGSATATAVPVPSTPLGLFDQILLALGDFAVSTFFNFEPTEGGLVLI